MYQITVLIPAYNEELRLAATLRAVFKRQRQRQVIVVDDGSRDRTAEIAAQFPVELVRLPTNQGKAKAVEVGLRQATGEIIVLLDGDLAETAYFYPQLVDPLLTGTARMVVARLTSPKGSGGVGVVRKVANWGCYWLTRQHFPALLSGQRAFFYSDLPYLLPLGQGFGLEFALTVRAIKKGIPIVALPVPMEHAYTVRNFAGFRHRSRQFRDICRTIWQLRGEVKS